MSPCLSTRINSALKERGRRIALVTREGAVSGEELRDRALDLAATLRTRGVEAGDTVGILVDRSVDSVVAMLAILDLKCAYLPLDLINPEGWQRHLIALARARCLVFADAARSVAGNLAPLLPLGIQSANTHPGTRHFGDGPDTDGRQDASFAYVMGTSGTTGMPKAVPIQASSVLHYCDAFAARVGGSEALANMRMASITTLAADLGNTMVFPSLLFGGELHLMSLEISRDPQLFLEYVQRHDIDAVKVVPTHLRVLLDRGAGVLPRRLLVVGGEPFGLDLLARLEACMPTCDVFNHYGPTEATIGVAMCPVSTKQGTAERLRARGHRTVPIGTPLGDNQLHIVDEHLQPAVEGYAGELVVNGPSLSDGYFGSADESSLRFVQVSWSPGGRIYRTGDLARVYPTGEFELFGRIDRQFKVRGHRVEAAGVEEVLRTFPGVFDAFVDYHDQGELGASLIAWVHAGADLDDVALRKLLQERLPGPMVPSRVVVMNELPRTANGKVDSTALVGPRAVLAAAKPLSVEEAVVHVFSQVLGLPFEGAHDSFFRLGGHSLTALYAICRLREEYGFEVTVAEFYADPTPSGIARAARPATTCKPPQTTDHQATLVSPQVHALWTHLRLNPLDTAYEVPVRLRVIGLVTPEQIRKALTDFVARHEALRTRFKVLDGKPIPVVDDHTHSALSLTDNDLHTDQKAARLDIENGPVVRGTVTEVGPNESLVKLLVHHIVFDGISTAVLVRELAATLNNEPLPSPQDAPTEAHVSLSWKSCPLGDGARARFGLPHALLIVDGPCRRHELRLPADLWTEVEACATALSTTPFAIAAAAWALVLSRQDGEPAVTICTPADLRNPSTESRLVGYYTNLVVIEVEHQPEDRVRDLVKRAHSAVGRAIEDRHRPYATRVADQRTATGTPPARTLLAVERLERARRKNVEIQQETVADARPILEIDVSVVLAEQTATIQIHHRVNACPEGRARCLGDQLIHVLTQFVADPEMRSDDVSILPPAWLDRVTDWSRGPEAYSTEEWGTQALFKHVVADPGARALLWPGGAMSRAQLAEAITRTSQVLRERGLGPGHAVAVAVQPSPALAVAWHAAHSVGAAVLALDPTWPQARLDSAARLAQTDVRITSPDGATLDIVGFARKEAPHDCDLAYFILTSGSTGTPKLVAIQHSALANELSWSAATFPLLSSDLVLAQSSPAFDVTVWEVLGPLSWGAGLVFPAMDRRNDIPHLAELIQTQGVTVIQAVPSLLEALFAEFVAGPLRLRLLLSGGEEMPSSLPLVVAQRLPEATLVNTYGPSETTIDATFHRVHGPVPNGGRVPLGTPVAGTCAYVLDDRLRLVPPGTWGQLAITGKSVGRGYIGDPVETARRFIISPFDTKSPARMYLTGDRARWNDDGVLEFGGRLDHQIKVRGNRVELEEVEAALRTLPMVKDAVVHLQHGGTMRARLVALIVPSQHGALRSHDLHKFSARILPSYMTPSVFGLVESLPRLSNGKVARDSLPLDVLETSVSAAEWQTEMETRVGRVWSEVLSYEAIQRDLPFFASGGTSLLIPILQLRLKQAIGVTLSVPQLFEHTTVSAQAAALEQRLTGSEESKPILTERGKLRRQAYEARTKRSL